MARIELLMPKMGESVSEATIISWTKEIGDVVEIDDNTDLQGELACSGGSCEIT